MSRLTKRTAKRIGQAPGSLIYVGEKRTEKVNIKLIDYDEAQIDEKDISEIKQCLKYKDTPSTTWININGLHDVNIIESIGAVFGIHPLVLEDVLNTGQRPKMDVYETYTYIVFNMVRYNEEKKEIGNEQVSLILGRNYIISLQEKEGDVFDAVRERLRNGKGRIRRGGPDYLAYALVDAVVDSYFVTLEKIGEVIEELEDELISDPQPENLHAIHKLRREMILLRKSVWPLREVINGLLRGDSEFIQQETGIFLRDVYDHTIQVIDTIESFRDMVSGMLDTYLSSLSNRMNEVMKVLTIIATIFIPLTFIAGVYGMNFEHMPELKWNWIYPDGFWAMILLIGGFMVYYFKRKKWF